MMLHANNQTTMVTEKHFIGAIELDNPSDKSVIQVSPGTISWDTRIIKFNDTYWIRDHSFSASDRRGWIHIEANRVIEIR